MTSWLRAGMTARGPADVTVRDYRLDKLPMQILVADDHDLVRDGLKPILHRLGPDVRVFECGTFPDAMQLADEHMGLDLAVLDLRMPGMVGTSGISEFRRRHANIPVMILSGNYRRQDVVDALHHGAMGFVPKTLGADAMLNAFRLVLAGEKFIPADLLPSEEGNGSGLRPGDEALNLLTERERDVLEKLLEGLPNKAIARELDIQEVTVKLHLRNVYRKLGAANRAHAVKIAMGLGLGD